jgi:hypothetical protein
MREQMQLADRWRWDGKAAGLWLLWQPTKATLAIVGYLIEFVE